MKTIEYYAKNVYGETKFYAIDETINYVMKVMANVKTITPSVKDAFEKLGYTFVQVVDPKLSL